MPKERKSRGEIMNAIGRVPALADLLSEKKGHYEYELDLEVCVYGRNYQGKRVGPYFRLFTYDPGETIVRQGDWGGNTFFVGVDSDLDVFIRPEGRDEIQVAPIPRGRQFGEMSVLAGVPRAATVKAPEGGTAQVLEIQRPALRLLRKIPHFRETLDTVYRHHGRLAALQRMNIPAELSAAVLEPDNLDLSEFRVFSKNHVLFSEGGFIDTLFVVKEGWLRRSSASLGARDFLGQGYCFGLEGARNPAVFEYTVTLLSRTEVLAIPLYALESRPALAEALIRELNVFAPPGLTPANGRDSVRSTQERLIATGLIDATNLLVMDMGLCVRCGRCSMACHEIHGHSRLVRRGIDLRRADKAILAPMACMHCKDPECLTGCPTGAISRQTDGQIDINARTCIGCGDCAVNCPYNAISMVPKNAKAAPALTGKARLRELIQIQPAPLPPATESSGELLAVKCNLCRGTTLNADAGAPPAYGCEENCPTGALARIDPNVYFSEMRAVEGPAYTRQRSVNLRNIHASDPPLRRIHLGGLFLAILMSAAALFGIRRFGFDGTVALVTTMRWLTGLVGLLAIAGAMAYPRRRRIFRKRAGPLRYWMAAHIWMGVAGAALILIHGGVASGGLLTTALAISFDVTILTGLWGIVCYRAVPGLLNELEDGHSLLADDVEKRRVELQRDAAESFETAPEDLRPTLRRAIRRFSSSGFLLRQIAKREPLEELLESARREIGDARADGVVDALAALRRLDAIRMLQRLLKSWLPPHVAATAVMLALLAAHIVQVVYGVR